jgi:hypothetical protein
MKPLSRKTSRILSIIGFGVAFASFVVKDVMSERLRSASDSLAGAQSFYLTQTSSEFIEDELNYIKEEVDLTKVAVEQGASEQRRGQETTITVKATATKDHIDTATEYTQVLYRLSEKVGEQDKMEAARKLVSDAEAAGAQMKSLNEALPAIFAAIDANPNDTKAAIRLQAFFTQVSQLQSKAEDTIKSAGILTKAIYSGLGEKLKRTESKSAVVTIMVYVAFALGWLISLLGQLFGPGDATPTHEQ